MAASILDRYGIKEVADVTFYEINSDGSAGKPVLFLDTLKVSTIEQTAETADARGGKGNPILVSWDYGKEITVTLEDALFSPKSMAIMFGKTDANGKPMFANPSTVLRSINFTADSAAATTKPTSVYSDDGVSFKVGAAPSGVTPAATASVDWYDEDGTAVTSMTAGAKYIGKFNVEVTAQQITVSANSFPGTYYIVGDTYARSEATGKDELFQFIIPKAKMTAENTITLEAEGDPSVFNLNLRVLRPADGEMMKLVQYKLGANG